MRTLALATLLTLIAVAAACGGGPTVAVPDPTAAPTEDAASGQDSGEQEEMSVAEVAEDGITEAPSGGVFRRVWSDPPTLDPPL